MSPEFEVNLQRMRDLFLMGRGLRADEAAKSGILTFDRPLSLEEEKRVSVRRIGEDLVSLNPEERAATLIGGELLKGAIDLNVFTLLTKLAWERGALTKLDEMIRPIFYISNSGDDGACQLLAEVRHRNGYIRPGDVLIKYSFPENIFAVVDNIKLARRNGFLGGRAVIFSDSDVC